MIDKSRSRVMMKCYFTNPSKYARCTGCVSASFVEPRGLTTPYEKWLLMPVGFQPTGVTRSRLYEISDEVRRFALDACDSERAFIIGERFFEGVAR